MKTYLAVRNKSTNQIKLYESNQVRVGAITRNIPTTNPVLLKEDEEEEMGEVEKREERKRSKKHLVTEFGQTKGRRIYEQADRMQVIG